jgi:hypothetical protein
VHSSLKWYKILALHILYVALLIAHALFQTQNEKGMSLSDFQMSVIRRLLEERKERRMSSRGGRCSGGEIPQRLADSHCLSKECSEEASCVYIFGHQP